MKKEYFSVPSFCRAAIEELLQVAKPVRIFPRSTLERKPSPHVEPTLAHLSAKGWRAELVVVPYEFLRGGSRMLRLGG